MMALSGAWLWWRGLGLHGCAQGGMVAVAAVQLGQLTDRSCSGGTPG